MRPGSVARAGPEARAYDTDRAGACDAIVIGVRRGQRGTTTMELARAVVVPSVSGMATPFFQTVAALGLDPAT